MTATAMAHEEASHYTPGTEHSSSTPGVEYTPSSPSTDLVTGVTYEYRAVPVKYHLLSLARDTYTSFGWTPDGRPSHPLPSGEVVLSLKRDRHIKNRPMVNELQRKAEAALADIDRLEKSKSFRASIAAYALGIGGAAALAGSIFTFQAGIIVAFVPLGVIGLAAWAAGYFVYRTIRDRKATQVAPLIDQQYDVVYEASEQAHQLLA